MGRCNVVGREANIITPIGISTPISQLAQNSSRKAQDLSARRAPNLLARRARHQRVFAKSTFIPRFRLGSILQSAEKTSQGAKSFFSPYLHGRKREVIESNTHITNNLFKRYTAMVALLFVVGSITPMQANGVYAGEYGEYYVDTASFQNGILSDGEGYLTKMNPQTYLGDRTSMTDSLTHTVKSGETLSVIANGYGLKTNTVLWANGLSNANTLKVGQKLVIPPVDGVTHSVGSNETIEKIAEKYKVDAEAVKKQNGLLASADISAGDKIYIPGGEPIAPPRATPARVGTASRAVSGGTSVAVGAPTTLADSTDVPVGGASFIFPTRGKITQGYRAGHYAYDIADRSKPPIWAAGGGTVVKASSGTWGGGYGNHIIIDHGNGLQTLYAHLDYLSVGVGDYVTQGQVIGRMGNTGNVRGVTGIHLHWEVIKNGVKQVPSNYY